MRERLGEGAAAEVQEEFDDGPAMPMSSVPLQVDAPVSEAMQQQMDDPGLMVPVTPPRTYEVIDSPRMSPATRPSDEAIEESSKKQRTEEAKKQRIHQLKMEYEQRLSTVRVAYKEYFTMDDYSTDLDVDGDMEDDVWAGEENICLTGIPIELWSDAPTDRPPEEPAQWVDDLADKVEIQRLCNMQVLVAAKDFSGEVTED